MKRPYILRPGMIFIASLVAVLLSLAAGTASAQGVLSVTNGIYNLFLSERNGNGTGTFTVSTGDLHPFPDQNVLFGGIVGFPWSSFLTIRSYTSNTDYVSTSDTALSSSFAIAHLDDCSPVVSAEGHGFRTTWSCRGPDMLDIEQVAEIEGATLNNSFIRVTTTVTNRDRSAPVQIGIRYMWDWMIDGSDDSMLKRHHPDDSGFTSTFFEVVSPQFEYYEETNTTATFSIFGTVNGPASMKPPPTPPDRFNYSSWGDAFSNTWDFPVMGGDSDSATCYFWGDSPAKAIALGPGESYPVTQYITTFEQSIALTISGVVRWGGIGLSGVTLMGLDGTPTTDSAGRYSGTIPYGWSGAVTPTKEGYIFDPVSRSYQNVTHSQVDQNYLATANNNTISGYVRTSDLLGIGAVVMNGLPGTPSTDNSGRYEGAVPTGWSGAVTPIKNGYVFDPSSRVYANVTTGKTEENYTGTPLTFPVAASVSGGHGTVDPASQIVLYDGTAIVHILPDPGYHILSIVDNGVSKSPVDPYVISGVKEDHTVVITFELAPILSVTPPEALGATGNQGGPFIPASQSYSVSNTGGGSLNWTVSVDQSWVTVSPAGGMNSGTVTVSINGNANSLPESPGGTLYTATVTFNSNGGSTTRQVTLTVSQPTLAYITNADDNTVSVIDMPANSVLTKIHVGQKPMGVAASKQRMAVYVTNYDSNTVSLIDAGTNAVTATINVGSNPVGIAIDKAGSTLYVVNYKGNSVSVVDTATNQVVATVKVGTEPCGVAVSPDGSTAYVTDYRSGTVSVIQKGSSAFEVTARIKVGTGPYGIAVHPSGSTLYVANYAAGTVSVIDAATHGAVAKVKVGGRPTGVALNPAGTLAYVTRNDGGIVSVIDTTTYKVVRRVKVGRSPFGIATNMDGTRIFVANSGDNSTSVIDASDFGIESVSVGKRPMAFGDFIISGQEGGSIALQQSLKLVPAQEGEDSVPREKLGPPAHPPHVE